MPSPFHKLTTASSSLGPRLAEVTPLENSPQPNARIRAPAGIGLTRGAKSGDSVHVVNPPEAGKATKQLTGGSVSFDNAGHQEMTTHRFGSDLTMSQLRGVIRWFVLAVMLLTLLASTVSAQVTPTRVRVTSDQATIWRPGFTTIATLASRDEVLEVVAVRGDWYEVVLPAGGPSGNTGFILARQVEPLDGAPRRIGPPVPAKTPPQPVTAVRPSASSDTAGSTLTKVLMRFLGNRAGSSSAQAESSAFATEFSFKGRSNGSNGRESAPSCSTATCSSSAFRTR